MDDAAHKRGTGVSNRLILQNAAELGRLKFPVTVRLPLIPGFNDQPDNLEQMGAFMEDNGLNTLEIMPYHQLGVSKYPALLMDYEGPLSRTPDTAGALDILNTFDLDVLVHGE